MSPTPYLPLPPLSLCPSLPHFFYRFLCARLVFEVANSKAQASATIDCRLLPTAWGFRFAGLLVCKRQDEAADDPEIVATFPADGELMVWSLRFRRDLPCSRPFRGPSPFLVFLSVLLKPPRCRKPRPCRSRLTGPSRQDIYSGLSLQRCGETMRSRWVRETLSSCLPGNSTGVPAAKCQSPAFQG